MVDNSAMRLSDGRLKVALLCLGSLAALAAAYFFGVDPRVIFGLAETPPSNTQVALTQPAPEAPRDTSGDFVSDLLSETENTWTQVFAEEGETYIPPRLKYFEGSIQSGCRVAESEFGSFYCAVDHRVYVDLTYFRELAERFPGAGDFAQAYVIAHEVGHHVQNLRGIDARMRESQQGASAHRREALQLRLELQADCFAGIWAHSSDRTHKIVADGKLEDALRSAATLGNDLLQRQSAGLVAPDPLTHGTEKLRLKWFNIGLRTGLLKDCNTFKVHRP